LPWATDVRFGSPTFGKCVSQCQNGGIANPDTKRCNCRPGWEGALCEINMCAPFGVITGDGTASSPLCTCISNAVTGPRCQASNCGPAGTLDYGPTGLQPVCRCSKLWTGALCDQSLCSIPGDDGKPSGSYQIVVRDGQRETVCNCRPGYGQDANAACSRPKCG